MGKLNLHNHIEGIISPPEIIQDCNYTLEQALQGKKIPEVIRVRLVIIDLTYFSFDKKIRKGQMIIDKGLKKDVVLIFRELEKIKFPLASIIPVSAFRWSDDLSMRNNNTSAFNYRYIKGTKKLSNHSFGKAIDINPLYNPQIKKGSILPHNGSYIPGRPGTITVDSPVVKLFKDKGWAWGGEWENSKDYQHFEKLQ